MNKNTKIYFQNWFSIIIFFSIAAIGSSQHWIFRSELAFEDTQKDKISQLNEKNVNYPLSYQ